MQTQCLQQQSPVIKPIARPIASASTGSGGGGCPKVEKVEQSEVPPDASTEGAPAVEAAPPAGDGDDGDSSGEEDLPIHSRPSWFESRRVAEIDMRRPKPWFLSDGAGWGSSAELRPPETPPKRSGETGITPQKQYPGGLPGAL
eukprot:3756131-Alexandrium_andersonii.AAC.1